MAYAKYIFDFLNKTVKPIHLRNEFDFWKVHEIMNTSGVLQSK